MHLRQTSPRVQVLDLASAQLGRAMGQPMRTLAEGLAAARGLRTLCLAFNVLRDEHVRPLAAAVAANPRLDVLDLNDNDLGDVGAEVALRTRTRTLAVECP